METESYHIYAKDRVLYCNLDREDFEEKWQLLNVMVGLLSTEYTEDDLLNLTNFGQKSLDELVTKLDELGLSLPTSSDMNSEDNSDA